MGRGDLLCLQEWGRGFCQLLNTRAGEAGREGVSLPVSDLHYSSGGGGEYEEGNTSKPLTPLGIDASSRMCALAPV